MDELFNRLIYSFIDSEFTFPFIFQKIEFRLFVDMVSHFLLQYL